MKRSIYISNERELLLRTADGDQSAFAALYQFYYPLLATHIYRITKVQALTDEITQDVFLKIWVNRARLRDIVQFRSYLGTLSRNATLNELRNLQRKAVRHKQWEREQPAMAFEAFPSVYDDARAHVNIDLAIEQLPQRQRHVYILSRRQHLKYAQIAQEMHLTPGTVKRYLQLARATIAKHIRSQISTWLLLLSFFLNF